MDQKPVRLTRPVVLSIVAVLLAGCGGGSGVEQAVAEEESVGNVTCTDAGWMIFVGERETVYQCATGEGVEVGGATPEA